MNAKDTEKQTLHSCEETIIEAKGEQIKEKGKTKDRPRDSIFI